MSEAISAELYGQAWPCSGVAVNSRGTVYESRCAIAAVDQMLTGKSIALAGFYFLRRRETVTMLKISDVCVRRLARELGTPLQIFDQAAIEKQLSTAQENFRSEMFDTEVAYATKAFGCGAMYKIVNDAGAYLDVVSGGEMYGAHKAGMDMDRVFFHGNSKTEEEIEQALELGCGTIVLDNIGEAEKLVMISDKMEKGIDVVLRINPGIEAHTHEYVITANIDSKFGISVKKTSDIHRVMSIVDDGRFLNFKGFHMHIGSQITDPDSFGKAIETMSAFADDICERSGYAAEFISLGGGFGIKYTESDKPVPLGEMARYSIKKCEEVFGKAKVRPKRLCIEPGRSVVGEAGVSVYKVGYLKDTETLHYAFVDGGMSDNIRPALYGSEYTCAIVNKENDEPKRHYYIAGKNCESADIIIHDAFLPELHEGDYLIVYATGAYGYSMASNYNKCGRPPVVFVKDGEARLVIKRETYEDMTTLETDERIEL